MTGVSVVVSDVSMGVLVEDFDSVVVTMLLDDAGEEEELTNDESILDDEESKNPFDECTEVLEESVVTDCTDEVELKSFAANAIVVTTAVEVVGFAGLDGALRVTEVTGSEVIAFAG